MTEDTEDLKVIQGTFGDSSKNQTKASDFFQNLADHYSELEDKEGLEDVDFKACSVVFCEGVLLNVFTNETVPDAAYMLFHMGADTVMRLVLQGEAMEAV